jgi:hypothetical protein
MSRTCRARMSFAVALLVLAAGCQDYNFNPVGHCLIQTGTKRVTLSNISSADVLFVVDDSGSMQGEQTALAENFGAFIGNLDAANAARQSAGLEPFDFNIAVTSTSVLWNYQTSNTCRSDCTGAAGQLVCCKPDNAPAQRARACTPGVTACPGGTTCGTNCTGLRGENYCCDATGVAPLVDVIPCSRAGIACGTFERHYNFQSCVADAAEGMNEWPLPQGDFMSWSNSSTPNPRVLHFDKELYTGGANRQGFTRQQLIDFFSSTGTVPGNVRVGTCGSGTEQALAAARLAIEKARDGRQRDTYPRDRTAGAATVQPTWNLATRTAGSPADWFTAGANSKLVVVFVGDEDDCSPSSFDPSGAVVWTVDDFLNGNDSCELDATRSPPLGGKLQPISAFVDFFTGLGRPVAAAFILPATQDKCTLTGDGGLPACTATARCCPPGGCTSTEGAQGRGTRLLATAQALAGRGVEVVAGSICDSSFGDLLNQIAELVKPPSGLELPGVPAADEVTILRIASASGVTRKICSRPLAPTSPNYTLAQAQDTGADWWFTPSADPAAPASGATRFVYINPKGACLANPGETYSADYIGRVPEGGCYGTAVDPTQGAADAMCRRILGDGQWTCWSGTTGDACRDLTAAGPTQSAPGTCICGSRDTTCK